MLRILHFAYAGINWTSLLAFKGRRAKWLTITDMREQWRVEDGSVQQQT